MVDIHACLKSIHEEVKDTNPNFKIHFGNQYHQKVDGKKEIMTKSGETFDYKQMIKGF